MFYVFPPFFSLFFKYYFLNYFYMCAAFMGITYIMIYIMTILCQVGHKNLNRINQSINQSTCQSYDNSTLDVMYIITEDNRCLLFLAVLGVCLEGLFLNMGTDQSHISSKAD